MSYEVEVSRRAEADLSKLDQRVERQVRGKIDDMAATAETWPHEALTGQYRGQSGCGWATTGLGMNLTGQTAG